MLQFHIAVCDDEPFAASSISGAAERELAARAPRRTSRSSTAWSLWLAGLTT